MIFITEREGSGSIEGDSKGGDSSIVTKLSMVFHYSS